jgi:hypothetical protein
VFGVARESRGDATECGAAGGCRNRCRGQQDLCLPNAADMRTQADIPSEPPRELEEEWEAGTAEGKSWGVETRHDASNFVKTVVEGEAGKLCLMRPNGVVLDIRWGYVLPGTYCSSFTVDKAWTNKTEEYGRCGGSATVLCKRKYPNPAHAEWTRTRDAALKNNHEFEAQQQKEKFCQERRDAHFETCVSECERNCQAGSHQGGQPLQPQGGSGQQGGSTQGGSAQGGSAQGGSAQGGSAQQAGAAGGGSTSESADTPSSGGGANLAPLADLANASASSSGDGAKALLAAGGIGGVGAAIGSGASTDTKGPNAAAAAAAYKEEVQHGKNTWQPAVISLGAATVGFLSLLLIDLINENQPHVESDSKGPTDLNSWSWLFGVDGPTCWWSRFDFQFQVGYHGFTYDGVYVGIGDPSTSGRGKPVHAPIDGHFVGGTARWGLVRASVSYLGAYGAVLDDVMKAELARLPKGSNVIYSESQVYSGLESSIGLQIYQGLLSPYVDYRVTALKPQHAILAGNGGFLYMPVSGTWVVGNTFNFSGVFASSGPLRRSLVLDVSVPLGKGGVVTSGLRIGAGYTVSWF